jgi:hypothetical protein
MTVPTKISKTSEALANPLYAAIVSLALSTLMKKTGVMNFKINTNDDIPEEALVVEQNHDTGEIEFTVRPVQWGDHE